MKQPLWIHSIFQEGREKHACDKGKKDTIKKQMQILEIKEYKTLNEKCTRRDYQDVWNSRRTWVTNVENKLMVTKPGSGSGMNSEVGIDIHTLLYIKRVTNENLWHRELCSILCGDPKGKQTFKSGYMYMYNWFTLFYSRNQYNIVKQLYSN